MPTTSSDYTNIVVGDFNCPKIDWNNYSSHDYISKLSLSWAVTNGYFQFVNSATRGNNTCVKLA